MFKYKLSEKFIMIEVGESDVRFRDGVLFSPSSDDELGGNIALTFGVNNSSGIVFAGSLSETANFTLFNAIDGFEISERSVMLGYSVNVARNFRIVPIIGFSFWDLEAEEGRFLNPGPEETREMSGVDDFFRLNLEFPVGQLIHLTASYINADYDFGDLDAYRFGVKFVF